MSVVADMQMARAVESVAGGFLWNDRSLSSRQLRAAYGDRSVAVQLLALHTSTVTITVRFHWIIGAKKII